MARSGKRTSSSYIIASTGHFSLDTPAHEKLAENMIRYTGQPSDVVPPAVTLYPLPRATSATELTVTGSIEDAGGIAAVEVLVNGVPIATPALGADGAVSATITLAPGSNAISLRARDAAGNTAAASAGVLLDVTAPEVVLDDALALTGTPTLTVSGNVADNDGIGSVSILLNGAAVAQPMPDAQGDVSATIALVEGLNTIELRAIDQVGNASGTKTEVKLDTVRPAVQILGVPEITNQAQLAFSGTAHDPSGLARTMLLLNGQQIQTPAPVDGILTAPLALVEGLNTIELRAIDLAGNGAAHQIEVLLDSTAPALAVTSPSNGQVFGASRAPITVGISDATATTVTVNGEAASLPAGGGLVTKDVTLAAEGSNTITIEVTDQAGNTRTESVKVVLDLTAPILTTELANGVRLGPQQGNTLLVTLHVDDTTTTTATLGGTTYSLAAGGGVIQGAVALEEGQNLISMRVTDATGRATELKRTVLYDITPPAGALNVPEAGAVVRRTVQLSAATSDNLTGITSVSFAIDGGSARLGERGQGTDVTWLAELDTTPLADGSHTASVTMVDGVGNRRTYSTAFTVDNTPPAVALNRPSAGSFVSGVTTIVATANDARSGVDSITIKANGLPVGTCERAATCSLPFDTTKLPDGTLQITATALDRAGNTSAVAQLGALIDNAAPSKFLVSPAPGAVVDDNLRVAVNITDPGFASVECFVGTTSLGVSTSRTFSKTVELDNELDGNITVRCTAIDVAGNKGTEVATITIDRWEESFEPCTMDLSDWFQLGLVTMHIDGPNLHSLLPLSAQGITLVVPGGKPVPLVVWLSWYWGGFGCDSDEELDLRFDRLELVRAIKAGISAGQIDPGKPVPVTVLSNGKVIATDTIRVKL
jgi:hypothetical protein